MSMMTYTFASSTLQEEITVIITLPERVEDEQTPFATAVLLPDINKTSSALLRREPLERLCGAHVATLTLPGHIALKPKEVLVSFLASELPAIMRQFPMVPQALYAEQRSIDYLQTVQTLLQNVYPTIQWSGKIETLLTQLHPKDGAA